MSKIIILVNDTQLAEYPIQTMEVTVGAEAENNIVLEAETVARRQCKITKVNNRFVLTDVAGRKDTMLNGSPVITTELHNQDRITFGPFCLICRLDLFESLVDMMLEHISAPAAAGEKESEEAPAQDQARVDRTSGSSQLAGYAIAWQSETRLKIKPLQPEVKRRLPQGVISWWKNPAIWVIIGIGLVLAVYLLVIE